MTEATPFSSAGWARAWWSHWAEAGPSRSIVTVRDGARLVGPGAAGAGAARAVPGADRARPAAQQLLGRAVRARPRARLSATLAIRERARRTATSGMRCCWAACGRDPRPRRRCVGPGCGCAARKPTPYPGIELPASFDDYLAGLPRKRRKDLRRHMRRLDDGRLELRDVTQPDDLSATIDRWQDIRVRWWETAASAWTPSTPAPGFATSCGSSSSLMVPRGHGPGLGVPPRRRGGGRRGEPHRQSRLLLMDGRLRPGRRPSRPGQARDRREHPGEHRGGAQPTTT